MAFTDTQVRLLKAKLDPRYIRTRNSNGCTLSYVEGWHAIAEAIRIFGYEAWDRRTVSTSCVWTQAKAGTYRAVYTAKVRITVRAGDVKVVREGSGSCEAWVWPNSVWSHVLITRIAPHGIPNKKGEWARIGGTGSVSSVGGQSG